jgi:hypothetical protein
MSCNCLERGSACKSAKQNQLVRETVAISALNALSLVTLSFEHRRPDLQEQTLGNLQPLHA